ncbi:endonuclease/exonuclease/phosphatase (EEP) superfamily protein YafD [Deinobacterium chartae]|uniref:Endonuclease/exonuclease/phosphatase (EEP) superfamily protein YafD n=1 Tax=Deinobacterium chartae TaxID=521158 RepID=A0A841I067_9DEIO|nr:hypothetical protein [Deinobacterium chartae]MBB6097829.1 endonuclease/exonuclease/phosphatase (EEP) superfamily protein YafD [Deinobacterium chartae]
MQGRRVRVLRAHRSGTLIRPTASTAGLDFFARHALVERRRAAQVRALPGALESARGPALLLGDLNTPPRGLLYGALGRLQDAFAVAGRGLGYTFPSRLPLMRTDDVWSRGLRASAVRTADAPSDHRAVVADLVRSGVP